MKLITGGLVAFMVFGIVVAEPYIDSIEFEKNSARKKLRESRHLKRT